MKNNKLKKSEVKKIVLELLKLVLIATVVGLVLLVCLAPLNGLLKESDELAKVAFEYVENLEDEKVGEVSKAYPNSSTSSKYDFFIVARDGKTYFVDLDNKESRLIFTYELIEFNENNSQFNKMLDKSIKHFEK